tara:strand:+ start:484 stop:1284 length:801 start_codon:yes stop_codon:yes gene_type:complete
MIQWLLELLQLRDKNNLTHLLQTKKMKVHKYSLQDIRNVEAEKFKRNGIVGIITRKYVSCRFTKFFVNYTKVNPNQITLIHFLFGLASAFLISITPQTGLQPTLIIAGILLYFSKVFDSVDGQIARVKRITNEKGAWIDSIVDRFKEALIIFAISFALAQQTESTAVWFYGFLALTSVYMVSVVLGSSKKIKKTSLKDAHSKFFLTRFLNKIGLKPQFFALQSDTYLFITAVLIILNQLMLALLFFTIIMNLYWIAILLLMLVKKW